MSLNHMRARMCGVHLAHRESGRDGSSGRISNGAGDDGVVRGSRGGAASLRVMRASARSAGGGGGRHRHVMPPSSGHEKLRRHQAAGSREVLRRALMPASRRPGLRRRSFRPAPSRLCNMSMAA